MAHTGAALLTWQAWNLISVSHHKPIKQQW